LKMMGFNAKGLEIKGLVAKTGQFEGIDIQIGDVFEASKIFNENFDFIISRAVLVSGMIDYFFNIPEKEIIDRFFAETNSITKERGVHIHQTIDSEFLNRGMNNSHFNLIDRYMGFFGEVLILSKNSI